MSVSRKELLVYGWIRQNYKKIPDDLENLIHILSYDLVKISFDKNEFHDLFEVSEYGYRSEKIPYSCCVDGIDCKILCNTRHTISNGWGRETSSIEFDLEIDRSKLAKDTLQLKIAFEAEGNFYSDEIDGFYTEGRDIYLNDPNTTSGMLPSSFFFHQAAEIGLNPSQFITAQSITIDEPMVYWCTSAM